MKHSVFSRGIVGILFLTGLVTGEVLPATVELGVMPGKGNPSATPQPGRTPDPADRRDLSKYGVADIADARPVSDADRARRRVIGGRYDNLGWVLSEIRDPKVGGIGLNRDLPVPSEFPFDESSLVVIGEVAGVAAFLSNDRKGVYTEFDIRIQETIAGVPRPSRPQHVAADREGGVVRYPDGKRVIYQSSEVGLPRPGSKYVFFLSTDTASPNYRIVRSYDINGDKPVPVELGVSDQIRNQDTLTLLKTLRSKSAEISKSEVRTSRSSGPDLDSGKTSQQEAQANRKDEPTLIKRGELSDVEKEHSKLYKHAALGKKLTSHEEKEMTVYTGSTFGRAGADPRTPEVRIHQNVCEADIVILGAVKSKASQLTPDEHFIFTDYKISVLEVLKNDQNSTVHKSDLVLVTRQGGSVKFDDKTVSVVTSDELSLKYEKKYLLFLKRIPATGGFVAKAGSTLIESDGKHKAISEQFKSTDFFEKSATEILEAVRTAASYGCAR